MSIRRSMYHSCFGASTKASWKMFYKVPVLACQSWFWTIFTQMFCITLCVFLKKQTFCLFCSYFSGINVKYHDWWGKCLLKCHFWSFPPFIKALFLCNLNINASPPEGSPGNGMQLQNGSKKLLTSVVCGEAFPVCNGKGSWHSSC